MISTSPCDSANTCLVTLPSTNSPVIDASVLSKEGLEGVQQDDVGYILERWSRSGSRLALTVASTLAMTCFESIVIRSTTAEHLHLAGQDLDDITILTCLVLPFAGLDAGFDVDVASPSSGLLCSSFFPSRCRASGAVESHHRDRSTRRTLGERSGGARSPRQHPNLDPLLSRQHRRLETVFIVDQGSTPALLASTG